MRSRRAGVNRRCEPPAMFRAPRRTTAPSGRVGRGSRVGGSGGDAPHATRHTTTTAPHYVRRVWRITPVSRCGPRGRLDARSCRRTRSRARATRNKSDFLERCIGYAKRQKVEDVAELIGSNSVWIRFRDGKTAPDDVDQLALLSLYIVGSGRARRGAAVPRPVGTKIMRARPAPLGPHPQGSPMWDLHTHNYPRRAAAGVPCGGDPIPL